MYKLIPPFLTKNRLHIFFNVLLSTPMYFIHFIIFNSPLFYTIYNKQFNINIFIFSYLICGIFQGIINTLLYYISDVLFFNKFIDISKWKKTIFYDIIIYNTDSTYLYILGSIVYLSLLIIPKSIQWTLVHPRYNIIIIQLFLLFIVHDLIFYLIHYNIHKINYLKILHIKLHHDCPFDIISSRCALATDGFEGLIRDLYSISIATYIISFFIHNFYAYNWLLYYTFYSFWSMYLHTGVNIYHKIHHISDFNSNYGLYYISDYIMGTINLK